MGPPNGGLSPQALLAVQEEEAPAAQDPKREAGDESHQASVDTSTNAQGLTTTEQAQVAKLQKIDADVRRHEQAHAAAGGGQAGAPSYEYTKGPDGKQYAVAGEVSISVPAGGGDPASRIEDLRKVQKAALAPSNPSAQDLKVAAAAVQEIASAEAQLRQEQLEENKATREKLDEATDDITLGGDPTKAAGRRNDEGDVAPDDRASDITAQQAARAFEAAANLSSNRDSPISGPGLSRTDVRA